ncbi:MAG: SDR family oxidoreductase [Magnetococcus sp. DMHC-6]
MDLHLKGKLALVTAASEGIGLATAIELSREGAKIILCSRNSNKLAIACQKIKDSCGQSPIIVSADLQSPRLEEIFLQAVGEDIHKIDIFVYNTGGPKIGNFLNISTLEWDENYHQILSGFRQLVAMVIPGMTERRWGRVITLASVSSKQPLEQLILSNVFRPALVALMKTLSIEFGESGITFNTVSPGGISTARLESVFAKRSLDLGGSLADIKEQYLSHIPLRRFGTPEDVAAIVTFIASTRSGFINGTNISIDGGMTRSFL